MSSSRDPSVERRLRAGARTGTPVRDPTESIAPPDDDDDMDPLSSSQAPLGTRDPGRSLQTRIESPAARNRTPAPPEPPPSDSKPRSNRASKPPPRSETSSERPEERIG